MTDKRTMSLLPPQVKSDDKLKAFIEEPEKKLEKPEQAPAPVVEPDTTEFTKVDYPWEAPGVTPQIIKPFVLRFKQPDKLKAEYIVDNSLEYRSLHDYYLKAILKQIGKDLEKLEI